MSKLYPPTIDTPLAAFYDASALTIPIIDNKTVSKSEIGGYRLKIKNSSTGNLIATVDSDTTTFVVDNIPEDKMPTKQTYKIQIAYLDKSTPQEVGYYSSVATIKYTERPSINDDEKNNQFIITYENLDNDEKIYEYRFQLYRLKTGELIDDTGYILHRRESDALELYSIDPEQYKLKSIDIYKISEDLNEDDLFQLVYSYRTVNYLEDTLYFMIFGQTKASNEIFQKGLVNLKATQDRENGAVNITIHFDDAAMNKRNGSYILKRAKIDLSTSRTQYDDIFPWESVYGFNLDSQIVVQDIHWKDLTVANGETYIYSLCQFNENGIYSIKIYSNIIIPKFDYMYLYDGKRQLAIKYNPEMSSFKNDILEQKIETIGRRYPFIYRNGIVKYKEFPIGGLISETLDPDNLFFWKESEESTYRTQTEHNEYQKKEYDEYYNEKVFKLEVLEWLTNGKPKLFRSISEGNYLVQLINVSLSPEDKLARMLHKFSSTAYEIAELTDENLRNYDIISYSDQAIIGQSVETYSDRIELNKLKDGDNQILPLENTSLTAVKNIGIYITGALPMTELKIKTTDPNEIEPQSYYIGLTGNFILEPGYLDIEEFYIVKPYPKCLNCGYQGEMNGVCPECGSTNIQIFTLKGTLNIIGTGLSDIDFYNIDSVEKDSSFSAYQIDGYGDTDVLTQFPNAQSTLDSVKDIRYIAKLQIYRKYNLDERNDLNYKAKIRFADNEDQEIIIDLSSNYQRDMYEMNNITKMSSMILGNGLTAVFYYKVVTTHYSKSRQTT